MKERIEDFISLLKKWASINDGFIPYVFSGSSFTTVYQTDSFISEKKDNSESYWREEYPHRPYTGFDCSCIISRAAQICGIAYFYKDSTTLERNLAPLEEGDQAQEGDIIWFPGHVMIVSNVKENKLIEARGYGAGFGKIHEIALDKAFQGISFYSDLIRSYLKKEPLNLLARDGSLRFTLEEFKILKFSSYISFILKRSL